MAHGTSTPAGSTEGRDDARLSRRRPTIVTAGAKQQPGQSPCLELAGSTVDPDIIKAELRRMWAPDAPLHVRHEPRRRRHLRGSEAHGLAPQPGLRLGTVLDTSRLGVTSCRVRRAWANFRISTRRW